MQIKANKLTKRLLSILLLASFTPTQAGTVRGTVTDTRNGETLIGVTVLVEGSDRGAATDFDGNFVIEGLNAGTYDLLLSYVGYRSLRQSGVTVTEEGETRLDIRLTPEDLQLEEVQVVARANRESEQMLLLEQRQLLFATQAVGAHEMSRKGAGTAEAAVAQVAGVSKQEGVKNVFVRGLGDRYNATTLNGFAIPSEDPEYKNVSLDFFGSDVIRNIDVSKTFRATTGGDVGGASININTKELTGEQALSVEAGAGLDTEVPGLAGGFLRQDGVNYLGISRTEQPAEGRFDFANSLDPRRVAAPVNHTYGLSGGRQWRLGDSGHELSVVGVASHSSDYAYTRETVRSTTANGTVYQDQTGQRYSMDISQLGLVHAGLQFARGHELHYNLLLLHANRAYVGEYTGLHTETHQDADDGRGFLRRQQNNDNLLVTNQLAGVWNVSERFRLGAGAAYNYMYATEPDRRENNLSHHSDGTYHLTGSNRQRRFFSGLREDDLNLRASLRYRLSRTLDAELSHLSVGYTGRMLRDDFEAVEYNYSAYPGRFALDGLQLDRLYNDANFRAGDFNMTLGEANRYTVTKHLHSGYIEATHRLVPRLTLNGSLRADYVDLAVSYRVQHVSPGTERIRHLYWLPALHLKADLNDSHSLRLGASKSYTLPQSKEIAPYQYVNIGFTSQGNPNLRPSDNYNIDLKWDWYIGSAELLSVTTFYKHIVNPIGRVDQGNSAGLLTYDNIAPRATVAGVEAELRKDLLRLGNTDGRHSHRLTLGVNASYIYTRMKLDITNTAPRTSRLEGASPWLANGDLSYTFAWNGHSLQLSAVAACFSDRIHTIGTRLYNDIVEEGTVTLDFVSSLRLDERFTLKLKAANLLNPAHRLTRRVDGQPHPLVLNEYRRGMDVSFSISYDIR